MENKLIVFDVDGTLTDTSHIDSKLFAKAVMKVLHLPSIDTEWYHYKYSSDGGILAEIIQSKLNREPLSSEIELIKKVFIDYLKSAFTENKAHCLPIKGSQTIFNTIAPLGWDVAIATGSWEESAILKLNTAKIPYESIPLANSDDHIEREKIISVAIERAKTYYKKSSYAKIIYVGDKLWDKRAAKNLQIEFIGIGNEFSVTEEKDFFHISDFTNAQLETCLFQILK